MQPMGSAVEPESRQVEGATDEAFPQEFDIGQVLEGRVCHRDARQTVLNTFFSSRCSQTRAVFAFEVVVLDQCVPSSHAARMFVCRRSGVCLTSAGAMLHSEWANRTWLHDIQAQLRKVGCSRHMHLNVNEQYKNELGAFMLS